MLVKLKIQPKKMCISVQWEPTLPTRLIDVYQGYFIAIATECIDIPMDY